LVTFIIGKKLSLVHIKSAATPIKTWSVKAMSSLHTIIGTTFTLEEE
jgi:hypothetical protein